MLCILIPGTLITGAVTHSTTTRRWTVHNVQQDKLKIQNIAAASLERGKCINFQRSIFSSQLKHPSGGARIKFTPENSAHILHSAFHELGAVYLKLYSVHCTPESVKIVHHTVSSLQYTWNCRVHCVHRKLHKVYTIQCIVCSIPQAWQNINLI